MRHFDSGGHLALMDNTNGSTTLGHLGARASAMTNDDLTNAGAGGHLGRAIALA